LRRHWRFSYHQAD